MLWRTRVKLTGVVVASLASGLVGCAGQTRGPAVDAGADVQLDIFEAAVRGMMSRRDWTVMIDPRPIDVYFGPNLPDSSSYLSGEVSLRDARASVLRDLGASTGTAFPMRPGCTGVLRQPPRRDISGCPSEPEEVLVFAAIAEAREDKWVLPMISIHYAPTVRQGGTYEVIMIRRDGGWVLDRLNLLVSLD